MIDRPRRCSTDGALHVHRDVPGAVGEAEQEQADDHRDEPDQVAERRPSAARPPSSTAIAVTVRREPSRCTMSPASGSAISEPAAIASSTRPSSAELRSRSSRTCGMRDAQLAKAKPEPMKAA